MKITMEATSSFLKKPIFFLILALTVYFGFGLANITHYVTADEHFWLPYGENRVAEYWEALFEGDWEDTQINDKPGVTTAIISGLGLPFAGEAIDGQILEKDGVFKRYDPDATKKIGFLFRFPLLLFNGLFIFYFFWILKKITKDPWVSTWACSFILLSPIILGISQIVNPDTLFWAFGSGAMLTFYAYLQERQKKYVWLTLILFGFTLLSKYVGVIFFPFFLVMIAVSYLFHFKQFESKNQLAKILQKDLLAYAVILVGGVVIFSVVMPAAIADPEVLYESTVGFPGMLPIFLTTVGILLLLLLDSFLLKSAGVWNTLRILAPRKAVLEKILYLILFASILFVLLNWASRNSLIDLSHIPFDAKTKDSFTTDNPYLARYSAEWVPLIFSLVPTALFLLLITWAQALIGAIRARSLTFTLSLFFLIFYAAVIEQGLLVTARYSIILFPLAFILAAFGLRSLFAPKSPRELLFVRFILPFLILFFIVFFAVVYIHQTLPVSGQIIVENTIGNYFFPLLALLLAALAGFVLFLKKKIAHLSFPTISPIILSIAVLVVSAISLSHAYPHYFIYTNSLLPHRYLLFHSWGYGGYEAAEYLNQKPDAKNLTIWVDNYGTCEFFVGRCIKKTKLKTDEYQLHYMVRTLRGTVAPRFPYAVENAAEWEYSVGGRAKNYIKIYKNVYE